MHKHCSESLDQGRRRPARGIRLACALRDFFLAPGGADMLRAAQALAREDEAGPDLASADPAQVEFAFNRLFVGPMALEAPPFASVYLEPEPLVMGRTTLSVRGVYHALGLASFLEGSLPDDHLGLELDCAAIMRAALDQTADQDLSELRAWFVGEHMAAWIPAFAARASASAAHPVVTYCVGQLVRWLDEEIAALGGKARAMHRIGG